VDHVRDVVLEALANQNLPLEKLVEELRPDRRPAYNPLFQVMFSYEEAEPAPAPAADGRSPTQLNDEGFALNRQKRYTQAVPLLQRSVEAFRAQGRTTELGYAFALYNLAYALARTGHQDAAVPLLEERLRISDNQRDVVRRELRRIQGEEG
jgi:tetratricopeptide (TPR) repeat protein